jgi:hypothetical protein
MRTPRTAAREKKVTKVLPPYRAQIVLRPEEEVQVAFGIFLHFLQIRDNVGYSRVL